MPGVDDLQFFEEIELHIMKYKYNTMPIIVINITSGGLELT